MQTVKKTYKLIKENAEDTKELCKIQDDGELRIEDLEIFKTCFWNEPIPQRKLDSVIMKNLQARLRAKDSLNVEEKPPKINHYSMLS